MKPVFAICLALVMTTPPGHAQSDLDLPFDPAPAQDCLTRAASQRDRDACIGAAANACMDAHPDGETTIGMMSCLNQELDFWDARLNAIYGAVMAEEKKTDMAYDEIGSAVPRLAPALRDMQRAWIPFRNARCEYEQRQWGGGSGGGPAVLACLMTLTGEQALYLEGNLGDG